MVVWDIQDARWLELVAACPAASPFHHPSWTSFLAEVYGHRPFVLAAEDGAGRATMGLPVVEVARPLTRPRWVSLPFTDHCPLLALPEAAPERFTAELDEMRRASGIGSVEVREALPGAGGHITSENVLHALRLPSDPEDVLRSIAHQGVRRSVRKAQRESLTIRWGNDPLDLHGAFYGLHVKTRHRLGAPVQTRRFFRLLWKRILEPGLGFVVLAYADTVPVAGAVFLAWNGTIVYKYGASDPSAWPLRPNHLLFWSVVRWGAERGYTSLDFGRSDMDAHGLRRFKSSWGAVERPLTYTILTDRAPRSGGIRWSALAEPAIRRSPVWVSRALGRLLYKYAA